MELVPAYALRRGSSQLQHTQQAPQKSFTNNLTNQASTHPLQQLPQSNKLYLAQPTSSTASALPGISSSPVLQALLETIGQSIGFSRQPQTITSQSKAPYILSAIPTESVAGEIHKAGLANTFNPDWQALVADAVQKNGGLGNEAEGFLAWSQIGFVRFKNEHLSNAQNQKLAEISLELGYHIEAMPSRTEKGGEKISQWVDKFTASFDKEMATFLGNPAGGFAIKDGRKRFEMQLDPTSGATLSFHYKKHGGLKGWVQKMYKYIAPVADIVSTIGSFFPGIGTAVSTVAQGVKLVAGTIAEGTLAAKQQLGSFISSIASFIPGGSNIGNLAQSALTGVGTTIANGSTKLRDIVHGALSGISGTIPTTGNAPLDKLITAGIELGINASDKDRLTPAEVVNALSGLVGSSKKEDSDPAEQVPAEKPEREIYVPDLNPGGIIVT